jgi:anion-transporting  ArsA/GET3 family ATPase
MSLLQDERTCAVVLVTAPEEMPVTETIELARALAPMKLRVQRVVINCVLPTLFSKAERDVLEGLPAFEPVSRGDAAILAASARGARERVQAESIDRLTRELGAEFVSLPLLTEDASRPDAIRRLARRL